MLKDHDGESTIENTNRSKAFYEELNHLVVVRSGHRGVFASCDTMSALGLASWYLIMPSSTHLASGHDCVEGGHVPADLPVD